MSFTIPVRLVTGSWLLLCLWNRTAADETNRPASEAALPAIPAAEQSALKAAADTFMRQFSTCESLNEYKAAFEVLLAGYGADKANASAKAREMAVNMSVGQCKLVMLGASKRFMHHSALSSTKLPMVGCLGRSGYLTMPHQI